MEGRVSFFSMGVLKIASSDCYFPSDINFNLHIIYA